MTSSKERTKTATRVLLVDDDDGMRRSLEKILRLKGFAVTTAMDGLEAVARAEDSSPDCCLMDIKMPNLNGVEAYKRIAEKCPDTPVLFMTAYSRSSLIDEASDLAVEVLSKPLDIERMLERLIDAAAIRPLLIVDDDKGFSGSLKKILIAKGFEVQEAHSVKSAVACFAERPRSIVLLDMALGDGTGLDVLEEVKRENPGAAIVLFSGVAEIHAQIADNAGLSGRNFLSKPFEIEGMVEAIKASC
jgi:DNA-binding NtrC family response regulator